MLSVYTRHYPPCKRNNPAWRRCKCPKWIQGTLDSGEFIRRSAKTRSWEKAQKLVRKIEDPDPPETTERSTPIVPKPKPDPKRCTISTAVEKFLTDAKSRGLKDSTRGKLITLCQRQLLKWAQKESLVHLDELTTANLTDFRNGWKDGALSKKKKHEPLKRTKRPIASQNSTGN